MKFLIVRNERRVGIRLRVNVLLLFIYSQRVLLRGACTETVRCVQPVGRLSSLDQIERQSSKGGVCLTEESLRFRSLSSEVSEGSQVLLIWENSIYGNRENIGNSSELMVYSKENIRVSLCRHRLASMSPSYHLE